MHAGRLAAGDSALEALRAGISAILLAPQALFRTEFVPAGEASAALDPWAVASRLSYFLWSSMPDDELLDNAESGRLMADPKGEVRRMLADPRAAALVDGFAMQWLQLRRLDFISPDGNRFPSFDAALRAAMLRETTLFMEAIIREDRSVLELYSRPSELPLILAALPEHHSLFHKVSHNSLLTEDGIKGNPDAKLFFQLLQRTRTPDQHILHIFRIVSRHLKSSIRTSLHPPRVRFFLRGTETQCQKQQKQAAHVRLPFPAPARGSPDLH
jgi:hypothetical protein